MTDKKEILASFTTRLATVERKFVKSEYKRRRFQSESAYVRALVQEQMIGESNKADYDVFQEIRQVREQLDSIDLESRLENLRDSLRLSELGDFSKIIENLVRSAFEDDFKTINSLHSVLKEMVEAIGDQKKSFTSILSAVNNVDEHMQEDKTYKNDLQDMLQHFSDEIGESRTISNMLVYALGEIYSHQAYMNELIEYQVGDTRTQAPNLNRLQSLRTNQAAEFTKRFLTKASNYQSEES